MRTYLAVIDDAPEGRVALRFAARRAAKTGGAILILAGLAVFGSALTLPGIAGFVLTIGAAVDANVLINERIREEQRRGRKVVNIVPGDGA